MKPTSPLSLLLFLHLASASPLPERRLPSNCQPLSSCATFRTALPASRPNNTPPTRLTVPDFTANELSSPDTRDPARSPESATSRPAKSPPPREDDARRYWASLRQGADEAAAPRVICGTPASAAEQRGAFRLGGEYGDLMVVGIVVLFLFVVLALEMVERVEDVSGALGSAFLGRPRWRRGEIYLHDDEEEEQGLASRAGPMQYGIAMSRELDEKEAFAYDSDAAEKV